MYSSLDLKKIYKREREGGRQTRRQTEAYACGVRMWCTPMCGGSIPKETRGMLDVLFSYSPSCFLGTGSLIEPEVSVACQPSTANNSSAREQTSWSSILMQRCWSYTGNQSFRFLSTHQFCLYCSGPPWSLTLFLEFLIQRFSVCGSQPIWGLYIRCPVY